MLTAQYLPLLSRETSPHQTFNPAQRVKLLSTALFSSLLNYCGLRKLQNQQPYNQFRTALSSGIVNFVKSLFLLCFWTWTAATWDGCSSVADAFLEGHRVAHQRTMCLAEQCGRCCPASVMEWLLCRLKFIKIIAIGQSHRCTVKFGVAKSIQKKSVSTFQLPSHTGLLQVFCQCLR